jgi:hypothetical protein
MGSTHDACPGGLALERTRPVFADHGGRVAAVVFGGAAEHDLDIPDYRRRQLISGRPPSHDIRPKVPQAVRDYWRPAGRLPPVGSTAKARPFARRSETKYCSASRWQPDTAARVV